MALPGSHPNAVRLPPPIGLHGGLRWLDAGLTNTQSERRKGGLKLHPGIHGLDLRDWLIFDDEESCAQEVALKARALEERRPDVLQIDDGSTLDAQKEVHDMIVEHLKLHGRMAHDAVGQTPGDLEAAARLVPEDLILMHPSADGQFCAVAACVCFSFGDLSNRIQNAQTMAQLHAKVDGYDTQLESPVNRFLESLKVERPVWRTNWSVSFSGSLEPDVLRYILNPEKRRRVLPDSKPPSDWGDGPDGAVKLLDSRGVADSLFVKVIHIHQYCTTPYLSIAHMLAVVSRQVEYQAMRRLPVNSGYVLSAVKTFLEPFSALRSQPRAAESLATNVRRAIQTPFRVYKGLEDERIQQRILAYLDECTASRSC